MDLYSEDVIDHYENPRNWGEISNPDYFGRDANASCGDMIEFYISVDGEGVNLRVSDVKWKGVGCAISTASASKLSEWLKGKMISEIANTSEEEIAELAIGFGVNPGRVKCLMLPIVAVKKILRS